MFPEFKELAEKQGWDDKSKLALCLEYIVNQQDDRAFLEHLQRAADLENYFTDDAPAPAVNKGRITKSTLGTKSYTMQDSAPIVRFDLDSIKRRLTKNENCLEEISCPKCGSTGPFHINGVANFLVSDDGSSEFTDLDWDGDSFIGCPGCNHSGTVKDFAVPEPEELASIRDASGQVIICVRRQDKQIWAEVGGCYDQNHELLEVTTWDGDGELSVERAGTKLIPDTVELSDITDASNPRMKVRIEASNHCVALHPEGHARANGATDIIALNHYGGQLELTVWDDINQMGATSMIKLGGAAESNRRKS